MNDIYTFVITYPSGKPGVKRETYTGTLENARFYAADHAHGWGYDIERAEEEPKISEKPKTSTVKSLKKGAFFTLRNIQYPNENQVWIKGDYDRASKTYECQSFADINRFRYLKGGKEVFTEFTF